MTVHARLNDDGFSLIEFLVAIVIISVGMLGLLQGINLAINHNLTSVYRNQAVMLADERMTLEKTKPFGAISSAASPGRYSYSRVSVPVRNANSFKNYSVVKIGTVQTGNTTNVEIDVIWKHKGTRYVHTISSLVSRYQ